MKRIEIHLKEGQLADSDIYESARQINKLTKCEVIVWSHSGMPVFIFNANS